MNRRNVLSLSVATALGLALLPGSAVAQQKSLKEQLVGTWIASGSPAARAMITPMRRTRSACCARAVSGHAAPAPPADGERGRWLGRMLTS